MCKRPIAGMMQRGKARGQKTTKVIESSGRIKVGSLDIWISSTTRQGGKYTRVQISSTKFAFIWALTSKQYLRRRSGSGVRSSGSSLFEY